MTEMVINIENETFIPAIKRALSTVKGISGIFIRKNKDEVVHKSKTEEFRDKFFGKLDDPRSADEIISDIYSSRRNKDESELLKAFE